MGLLQKKQNSPTTWRLLILTVFVILTSLLFQCPINHDAGWYLYAAGAILDGAKIYLDLIDVNPPLIFWLHIPPVWLGRLLNCSAVPLFNSFFLFIVVLSLTLSTHILKKVLLHLPRSSQYCFLGVLIFLFLPYEMPWNCFGQREHLMLVFVTPYVFASAARLMGYPVANKICSSPGIACRNGICSQAAVPVCLFLHRNVSACCAQKLQILETPRKPGHFSLSGSPLGIHYFGYARIQSSCTYDTTCLWQFYRSNTHTLSRCL